MVRYAQQCMVFMVNIGLPVTSHARSLYSCKAVEMSETKRMIIPGYDQWDERVNIAISCAEQICEESGNAEIVFLAPTRASFEPDAVRASLGENAHQSLLLRGKLQLSSGRFIYFETIKTLRRVPSRAIIIVIYASQSMMDDVDAIRGLAAIVAVPWSTDVIADWQLAWSAQVYGQPKTPVSVLVKDPVIEQGLQALSASINPAHARLRPAEVKHARQIFQILKANQHIESPYNIRLWAVRHGWFPKAAKELESLFQQVLSIRKKTKFENPEAATEMYRLWCIRAF